MALKIAGEIKMWVGVVNLYELSSLNEGVIWVAKISLIENGTFKL